MYDDNMIEVIEIDGWSTLSEKYVVYVKSLEDLKRIAAKLGVP